METISTALALRERLLNETRVVFVPTLGNLHDGHLDLVRQARRHGDCVVVSIFVNPLQFGPSEDFAAYPRTLAGDCKKLEGLADLVFAPEITEVYPEKQSVFVEPPPIAAELCGAARPTHFRGVATVVLKLFNLVQADVAVFGKKDYQQLHVIRAMVRQLNLPVEIVAGETVRAADGLALSSRNTYLSEDERSEAVNLYRELQRIRQEIAAGGCDFAALADEARTRLESRGWRVDYVSLRNAATLDPALADDKKKVVLAAAWLGTTRLIDNLEMG